MKTCSGFGDNIFSGSNEAYLLCNLLKEALNIRLRVDNPSEYGIIEFDENIKPLSMEEKPKTPKSNYQCRPVFVQILR